VIFRKAAFQDKDFLFDLRNDSESAKFSMRGKLSHEEVLKDYFENPVKIAYIAENCDTKVGYLILEKLDADSVEISVAVKPEFRGKGFGKALVREGTTFATEKLGFQSVAALIFKANKRSLKVFSACLYCVTDQKSDPLRLEYKRIKGKADLKKIIFVFDFDGVICDSLKALYCAYIDFLNDFGLKGSSEEFELLNGPKLSEIVAFLKKRYSLKPEPDILERLYKNKISLAYENACPVKGVVQILEFLRLKKIQIALASSSDRVSINRFLKKFGLEYFFECIVTGEDVLEAKPSPQIYELIKKKFPDQIYYVVEDSLKGIKAAKTAGMNTVLFDCESSKNLDDADFYISSTEGIRQLVEEIELNCFTMSMAKSFELKIVEKKVCLKPEQLDMVNNLWEKEANGRKLTNGKILSYISHAQINEKIVVECFVTEYKFFLAQLYSFSLDFGIEPIGVSGMLIDPDGNTLIAMRKNLSQYKNSVEFVPAGAIDPETCKNTKKLHENQLICELQEEAGISNETIKNIYPYCLIYDKSHKVYDICSIISLNKSLKKINLTESEDENSRLEIVKLSEISRRSCDADWVPVSRVLYLNALTEKSDVCKKCKNEK
jgi:HAD superfamily hydrolase (TIGR01509 family)